MSTKIRVFIASTMKDLSNERHEVVRRVGGFNFEPVNAESWLPGGTRVWERIEKEIESCHLFVLILGDSYGWTPPEGPGAADGFAVTHMEARKAHEKGLPILPFLKKLDYDSPRDTEDARRRDAFRAEVADWAAGGVVTDFELASDLADKVGASLVGVLSENYLASEVRGRAEAAKAAGSEVEAEEVEVAPVNIPPRLGELAARQSLVLIAGAGISLTAGYPSMLAMTELVSVYLREHLGDPTLSLSGISFQEIANIVEAVTSRSYLLHIFQRAMTPPQGVKPTEAHVVGVRHFKTIITSNFDTLFEAACDAQGIKYSVVVDDETASRPLDGLIIFKLNGSLALPEKLLITESDFLNASERRRRMWRMMVEELTHTPALVVGSSLRDLGVKQLFRDVLKAKQGVMSPLAGTIVSPKMNSFEKLLYRSLDLRPVEATADAFFRALDESVTLFRQTRPE